MPVQRKAFRIEQMSPTATTATVGGEAPTARRDDDIRAELKALRELMERRGGIDPNADKTSDTLAKLREETEGIRRVLDRTRQEIASPAQLAASATRVPRANSTPSPRMPNARPSRSSMRRKKSKMRRARSPPASSASRPRRSRRTSTIT